MLMTKLSPETDPKVNGPPGGDPHSVCHLEPQLPVSWGANELPQYRNVESGRKLLSRKTAWEVSASPDLLGGYALLVAGYHLPAD